MGLGMELK